jgi:hypothetical protein
MANRFTLNDIWASGGAVIDPDLDTLHPIFEVNKYSLGWDYTQGIPTNNKQPHEWRNFMLSHTLESYLAIAESGIAGWDDYTTYKVGGVATGSDDVRYRSTLLHSNVDPVGDGTGTWVKDIMFNLSSAELADRIAIIRANIVLHGSYVTGNPHSVQADQFAHGASYFNYEIDIIVGDMVTQLDDHETLTNNPHQVTHTQINTLSATLGGDFVGQVDLVAGLHMNAYYIGWFSNAFAISFENYLGVGISSGGYPIVGTEALTDKRSELFHEGNYDRLRQSQEAVFALPIPAIQLPLVDSVSSFLGGAVTISFARPSTLNYTDKSGTAQVAAIDEDAYDAAGLIWTVDTTLALVGYTYGLSTLVWVEDGVLTTADVASWDGDITPWVTGATRVRDFRLYPRLTDLQKSMLA